VQPLKRGSGVFDIIICGGHRERGGVTLTPSQWRQPSTRVPITVVQHSERHVVGEGHAARRPREQPAHPRHVVEYTAR